MVETKEIECEEDRNLRTILRIRKRFDKENPDSLIEVENDTEVIFRPEGKNRADKYTFSKGKFEILVKNLIFLAKFSSKTVTNHLQPVIKLLFLQELTSQCKISPCSENFEL